MKWKCSLCNTSASSKCVDDRYIFIETTEGLSDVAHMVIEATTSVQWKEHEDSKKKFINCNINATNLKTLSTIINDLTKCPAVLAELLCDHQWCLDGADECELHHKRHRKLNLSQNSDSTLGKRQLPSESDIIQDFDEYKKLYKRVKMQKHETEKHEKAVRAVKTLFDNHAPDKKWDETFVIIKKHDEKYSVYAYSYEYDGVTIEYLSRITYVMDDCDAFIDALVKINGVTVYQEVKDVAIIDKKNNIC